MSLIRILKVLQRQTKHVACDFNAACMISCVFDFIAGKCFFGRSTRVTIFRNSTCDRQVSKVSQSLRAPYKSGKHMISADWTLFGRSGRVTEKSRNVNFFDMRMRAINRLARSIKNVFARKTEAEKFQSHPFPARVNIYIYIYIYLFIYLCTHTYIYGAYPGASPQENNSEHTHTHATHIYIYIWPRANTPCYSFW